MRESLKKFAGIAVCIMTIALGACATQTSTTGAGTTTTGTNPIANLIPANFSPTTVMTACQGACNFLPTADSVANVLSKASQLATAEDIAQMICAAVTSAQVVVPAATPAAAPTASPAVASAKLGARRGGAVMTVTTSYGARVQVSGKFRQGAGPGGATSVAALINGQAVIIQGSFQ
jgi:hypothetical protein